jgi:hypothetical protein
MSLYGVVRKPAAVVNFLNDTIPYLICFASLAMSA